MNCEMESDRQTHTFIWKKGKLQDFAKTNFPIPF